MHFESFNKFTVGNGTEKRIHGKVYGWKNSSREREIEGIEGLQRDKGKTRAEQVRKWSSFGDTRDTVQARKVAAKALLSLSFLPFSNSHSPLPCKTPSPRLTSNLLSLPRSSSLEPVAFTSFVRGWPCCCSLGDEKGGLRREMSLGGAVHPWRQHGPRKGGKKGSRRVRRVRAGTTLPRHQEGNEGNCGAKSKVSDVTALSLSLSSSKVDRRKYRRERERERERDSTISKEGRKGRSAMLISLL